jgi:hypothetical protein
MPTDLNKAALVQLREAYRRANSALGTIERAKSRVSDDVTLGLLILVAENVKEVRKAINAAARLLK